MKKRARISTVWIAVWLSVTIALPGAPALALRPGSALEEPKSSVRSGLEESLRTGNRRRFLGWALTLLGMGGGATLGMQLGQKELLEMDIFTPPNIPGYNGALVFGEHAVLDGGPAAQPLPAPDVPSSEPTPEKWARPQIRVRMDPHGESRRMFFPINHPKGKSVLTTNRLDLLVLDETPLPNVGRVRVSAMGGDPSHPGRQRELISLEMVVEKRRGDVPFHFPKEMIKDPQEVLGLQVEFVPLDPARGMDAAMRVLAGVDYVGATGGLTGKAKREEDVILYNAVGGAVIGTGVGAAAAIGGGRLISPAKRAAGPTGAPALAADAPNRREFMRRARRWAMAFAGMGAGAEVGRRYGQGRVEERARLALKETPDGTVFLYGKWTALDGGPDATPLENRYYSGWNAGSRLAPHPAPHGESESRLMFLPVTVMDGKTAFWANGQNRANFLIIDETFSPNLKSVRVTALAADPSRPGGQKELGSLEVVPIEGRGFGVLTYSETPGPYAATLNAPWEVLGFRVEFVPLDPSRGMDVIVRGSNFVDPKARPLFPVENHHEDGFVWGSTAIGAGVGLALGAGIAAGAGRLADPAEPAVKPAGGLEEGIVAQAKRLASRPEISRRLQQEGGILRLAPGEFSFGADWRPHRALLIRLDSARLMSRGLILHAQQGVYPQRLREQGVLVFSLPPELDGAIVRLQEMEAKRGTDLGLFDSTLAGNSAEEIEVRLRAAFQDRLPPRVLLLLPGQEDRLTSPLAGYLDAVNGLPSAVSLVLFEDEAQDSCALAFWL